MMARMSMKQSSCYSHPLTHQASDGFPMRVLHYDKLDLLNARIGYVKALRIVGSRANAFNERKNHRSFFPITLLYGFKVRRTGEDLRAQRSS